VSMCTLLDRIALPERAANGLDRTGPAGGGACSTPHGLVRAQASVGPSGTPAKETTRPGGVRAEEESEEDRFRIPFPAIAIGGGNRYRECEEQSAWTTSPSTTGLRVHIDCEIPARDLSFMAPTAKISLTVLRGAWFPIDLCAQGDEQPPTAVAVWSRSDPR
jgi:hypothetical protein